MKKKTTNSDIPNITAAQSKKLIPKLTKLEKAIYAKDKAKATGIYAEVKPYMTSEHRKAVEKSIARISKK